MAVVIVPGEFGSQENKKPVAVSICSFLLLLFFFLAWHSLGPVLEETEIVDDLYMVTEDEVCSDYSILLCNLNGPVSVATQFSSWGQTNVTPCLLLEIKLKSQISGRKEIK